MKTVYVDNNATTKVAPEVVEVMKPYFSEFYGNPSSMHFFGGQVQKQVNEAREQVADFLGAEVSEIVFTSCGTESDNAAILGTLDSYPEKRHFVTTRVEHPAVGNVSTYLGRKGYRVTELSVDREGRLDLDALKETVTEETVLVSIMYANNETGVIFPIEQIGEIVKGKGIPFPHGRCPGGRENPSQHEEIDRGHALDLGSQTPCPQGDRDPLYSEGDQVLAVSDRRSPGKGETRGDGKCPLHHRPRKGL